MNLSAAFIRRPVATTLLTVAIAIVGAVAFTVLPVAPLPQVDYPTISVNAGLPGASAQIMASSVATPLERQLGHIAGITEMTSSSSLGNTGISLQFDLSRDIDGAARDVQAAINAARTYLPANLPQNPSYRKVNPSDSPILILNLSSTLYPISKVYDLGSTVLMQKLSQIDGVGQVFVWGGSTPAVRVEVDPTKLESYGLTIQSVRSILSLQNSHEPRGQITNDHVTYDILTNSQIFNADDYKDLVIGYHNGSAVHLSDVAEITDSVQDLRQAGYSDGQRSITVPIFRQPGANIIDTVDRVKAQLPFLQAIMPQGLKITIVLDRTQTIRASVREVERTLIISICLVVIVVFLFLRTARSTVIPAVAVPVSLIGTFGVMYLCGFTLDNLSLMAMTISTGFVVDDAIVVMENITRHVEGGMSAMQAALLGAKEIGFTVFSISMSLIAVFIPILMMGGIVGRLFREFAITLSTAILISMVISLTTTPTMCAYLLKKYEKQSHGEQKQGLFSRWSDGFFKGMLSVYRRTLTWALDNALLVFVVLVLTIGLNVLIFIKIPKDFFPMQDTGALAGGMRGPQDASFQYTNKALLQIVQIVKSDPAVAHVNAYTGGRGSTNGGFIFVALKPVNERKGDDAMKVIARLRPKLGRLPLPSVFFQPVQDLRIGARSSNALYQYTLQSDNLPDLAKWAPILENEMRKMPMLADVNSDWQNGGLAEHVTYDRVAAARLGQTAQSLDGLIYSAFGQSQVSVMYTPLNQYYVVLEAAPQYWQSPAGLDTLYFKSSAPNAGVARYSSAMQAAGKTGASVMAPLGTVSTHQTNTTPLQVNHTGLFPSVTISFNLAPGESMSDAARLILDTERRLGVPETVRGFFAGTFQAYQESLESEWILGITAFFAVYIVLGILYESMMHPLTILSTLPSASVGAMLALMLFHMGFNVISMIGIILLIGIVKKNAIMMVDFALMAERNEGKSTRDSIFEACMLRFRPIMMTTTAAIFGALPLALGTGTGSELRRPLGLTIVGGLLLSQLITLYTTPVVYLGLDKARLWLLQRLFGKSHDSFNPQAPAPAPGD